MKKLILTTVVAFMVGSVLAQQKCPIKKAYAFYTENYPGVQMADENGNPVPPTPIIDRFIYVEWSGAGKPEITTVTYNNLSMTAELSAVEGHTLIPGGDIGNNKDHRIKANKCNTLWKIQLRDVEGKVMPALDCDKITIAAKGSGNSCIFSVKKETRLYTLPRY